jgi:outer membrane biosynthesis protein TonB
MGEITESTYTKARVVGIIGSAATGLALFLFLFFTYIYTPIPPYPEGGGGGGMDVEVNLGYADEGFGDVQQADIALPDFTNEVAKPAPVAEEKPDEILSQDEEETVNLNTPPKKPEKKPEVKTTPSPQVTKPAVKQEKVVEKPKTVNQSALYKPGTKTGTSSSQGNTQGSGDQGNPNGSQRSALYGPGGNGGGGSGSGSGGGIGSGTGTGVGNGVGPGISFNLTGRSMIVIQKPEFVIQREGIVVVEITVDRTGKVIKATPGVKGSTIIDDVLYAAAKKAAMESKFNLKSDAPDLQVGKITYHFKLQ